jgi:hypothetical protein
LPPALVPPGSTGRALDVSQWLLSNPAAGTTTFGAVPVSELAQSSLASLLSARDRYKQRVFAEAIDQLERDVTLADAAECKSVQQIETGTCLMSESLRREVVARGGIAQALRADAAAAAATAPAVADATPVAVAVATAPTAPPAPVAEVLDVEGILARAPTAAGGPGTRRIRTAALPQIDRKVAVLIGIDEYADSRIPRLSNAAADARAVGDLLKTRLGYETILMPNAGKQQIIGTLNALAATLGPRDSVVIYYAGHGQVVPKTGLGYWQPANADATKPETWLSNSDIGKLVGVFGATQVAVISDSCYSGSLVSDERIRPTGAAADANSLLERRAAVVMSSGGNEPVFDAGKNGHSPFAFSLMQALQGVPTWQAGGNVFERVRFAVARELPQRPRYGAAVAGGHEAGSDYLFERRELE